MSANGSNGRPPVSAVDAIVVVWNALPAPEQTRAFEALSELRLRALAGEENEMALYIRSLRRIAEHIGSDDLTPDQYRAAYKELRRAGDEHVIEFNRVVRFFRRWVRAKEALRLSVTNTPLKIEARFRSRMVGKVHRYGDEALREPMIRCAEELGRPPLVIEYEHWRHKEIELAKARGETLWLPSSSPYRRRWGTWGRMLQELAGFSQEEIDRRLILGRERANANLEPTRFRPSR